MTELVNDIHSELNEAVVEEVVLVASSSDVTSAVQRAASLRLPVAVAGGRHAMGGQQFCAGGMLLDTRPLDAVLSLDRERGTVEVEAGIQWPALIRWLTEAQAGDESPWAIAQKQTGADRLSIGGAIAANAHGRGLLMGPLVSDVESFRLVGPDGVPRVCSREENADLFALAVGGYGLFGCITSATLRLVPRRIVERVVEVQMIEDLMPLFEARIGDGFLYGDFQFAIDPKSDDFLRRGVFSCYRPVAHEGPLLDEGLALTREDWTKLIALAHTDKDRAFELYSAHYLATSGQRYYSDSHQLGDYEDGYHRALDVYLGATDHATEMISELYVPRDDLTEFMAAAADDLRVNDVDVIYGTVRLIERDEDSFLPWAREPWACVIFNLHTVHTSDAVERSAKAFRNLIDLASDRGGSYFLTYHRWATRDQVERCHPRFRAFLEQKLQHDPGERFQSDWYRHYKALFAA